MERFLDARFGQRKVFEPADLAKERLELGPANGGRDRLDKHLLGLWRDLYPERLAVFPCARARVAERSVERGGLVIGRLVCIASATDDGARPR